VRGLLCDWCNRVVGEAEHLGPGVLGNLAGYLEDPPLARMRRGEPSPYQR
jgi:hypothetical protein